MTTNNDRYTWKCHSETHIEKERKESMATLHETSTLCLPEVSTSCHTNVVQSALYSHLLSSLLSSMTRFSLKHWSFHLQHEDILCQGHQEATSGNRVVSFQLPGSISITWHGPCPQVYFLPGFQDSTSWTFLQLFTFSRSSAASSSCLTSQHSNTLNYLRLQCLVPLVIWPPAPCCCEDKTLTLGCWLYPRLQTSVNSFSYEPYNVQKKNWKPASVFSHHLSSHFCKRPLHLSDGLCQRPIVTWFVISLSPLSLLTNKLNELLEKHFQNPVTSYCYHFGPNHMYS